MTKLNPVIVYIGDVQHALALQTAVQPCGWTLLYPQDMMEALAMQVFYYPDAVVIEENSTFDDPRGVYAHLRSIAVENILVLSNKPASWGLPNGGAMRCLPTYTSIETLVDTLGQMVEFVPAMQPLLA